MTRPFTPRLRLKLDYVAAFAVTVAPIFYFLPALCNRLVLGPDDGMLFNVPLRVAAANIFRSGQLPLWNPYIFSGMPLFAAAQGGLLFPLNWLYLFLSPGIATNVMTVSIYMIAALGAYLFARRTEASIPGAVVTSLVWQAGGFMIGQISHINIVHTAAMLPWVLWALERYVSNGNRARGALLAVLVAIQVFAGHQQTFAYGFLLIWAYAIVMALTDRQLRRRYLSSFAFMTAGVLLGAVQIVPTLELLRNSPRATAPYDFFSSFSMPRRMVSTLVAPYVMGGGDGRLFRAAYVSEAYYTEYVVYGGVLAIMLALLAVLLKPERRTKFWAIAACICLLLAFGSGAPLNLYRFVYLIPVLNLFRVPARHLLEVNFALAVLAGRGLTVLGSMRNSAFTIRKVAISAGSISVLTVLTVTWWRPANFQLGRDAPLTLLRAPELFLPIVFAGLSLWAIWAFARRWRGATALLFAVLVVDLVMWGQFSGWYMSSRRIPDEFWGEPESVKLLRKTLRDPVADRILTTHENFDPAVPLSASRTRGWVLWTEPDVYMMFGIPNAAGYDGFGLERYGELAGQMKLWGELTDPNATLRSDSREIDLLNARYLVSRREQSARPVNVSPTDEVPLAPASAFPSASEKYDGLMFSATDLALPNIGPTKRLRLSVPPVEADRVALLTNLSWSEDIPDNQTVGWLRLKAQDGRSFEFPIRAGAETADWSYDRPDIRGRIKHKRPPIATSYDVTDSRSKYRGHTYVASFTLPDKVVIKTGEIVPEPDSQSPNLFLTVFRISLVNKQEEKFYPLSRQMVSVESASSVGAAQAPGSNDERWKLVTQGEFVNIYENQRALPRAWLASEVRVLDGPSMLRVIRTGILPDGSRWDPSRIALVEQQPSSALAKLTQPGEVQIRKYDANRIDLQTRNVGDSILVLSENDYPGWRAYVDGQSAEVVRTNYALRGVVVPVGEHQISFVYRPWSVLGGFLISLVTGGALIFVSRKKRFSARIA